MEATKVLRDEEESGDEEVTAATAQQDPVGNASVIVL